MSSVPLDEIAPAADMTQQKTKMVVISKIDENKVSAHISRMESELSRLRAFLEDVAHKSENQGHLDSGDMIVVTGRDHPDSGSRAVVQRVVYEVKKLEVVFLNDYGEAKEADDVTDLDVSQITWRRATKDDDPMNTESSSSDGNDDIEFPDSIYGFQSD